MRKGGGQGTLAYNKRWVLGLGFKKNFFDKEETMSELIHKKLGMVLLVLVICFLVTPISSIAHAKKTDIKITTVQMPSQQMGRFIIEFAKKVNSDPELKDKVQIKAFTSAQLYSGKEELEALSRAELEMAFVIGSKPEVLDPVFQIHNLPFLFPNLDVGFKVFDSEVGRKYLWSKFDKHNIRFLGISFSGTPVIFNSKRPILWPKDFKGLKLRSYGRMSKAELEALGATAVVTASEETFSALQQGVIDGGITPAAVYLKRKYYSIQKYVTDTGMMNLSSGILLANSGFWKELPVDVRSKLEAILTNMIAEDRAAMIGADKENFKLIASKGNEVHHLTAEQVEAWKEAMSGVYDEFGPEIGPEVIEKLRAEAKALSN
jgi:C4-dicarboxylate-binding protein DctP